MFTSPHAARPMMHRLENRLLLSTGGLDPSFGGDGIVTTPGNSPSAWDNAIQADGKTVVVGWDGARAAMIRYNFDGTLDTSFGIDGIVRNLFGNDFSIAAGVAIDNDGRIVVAGEVDAEFAVARFLPDGSPDTTFDGDGRTTFGITSNWGVQDNSYARDVVLQNDGKIVVCGYSFNGGLFGANDDLAVARLNPDGSLDKSFSGDGKKFIPLGADDHANAVAIDYTGTPATNPNYGKITLVGSKKSNGAEQVAIVRLKPDGNYDPKFGKGGKMLVGINTFSAATGILFDPDGKWVVSGDTGDAEFERDFAIMRFLPSGALDPAFGDQTRPGKVETDMGNTYDRASEVIHSATGGYLVGGASGGKFAVAAYDPDGRLDPAFVNGGKILTPAADGGIIGEFRGGLAAGPGRRFTLAGGSDFLAARYFDAGANLVVTGTFNPQTAESGPTSTNFIVGRLEHLPVATRVYFSIGGDATRPDLPGADYTLDGMTLAGADAYVDIPAGASFTTVTVTPIDDALTEPAESATFTILPNPEYTIDPLGSVTIHIADNDGVILLGAPAPTSALADLAPQRPGNVFEPPDPELAPSPTNLLGRDLSPPTRPRP